MSVFGKIYKVFTFGQSHSAYTGCIIEGFPSNFSLSLDFIQKELNRRRPGQSIISTPRQEKDLIECVSGMQNGKTLGSPLSFMVKNENVKKSDYDVFKNVPRPGHADFTYLKKYGLKAESGGGRSSARETIGRVIAGAVAKQYLNKFGIQFGSWVSSVGGISIPANINSELIKRKITNQAIQNQELIMKQCNRFYHYQKMGRSFLYDIQTDTQKQSQEQYTSDKKIYVPNIRCPHEPTAIRIFKQIQNIQSEGDSLGGIIQSCIYNLPVGLGQPVFDKLQALIAHGMLSIPAVKGFQFGSGFRGTTSKGSEHNDLFDKDLKLQTNHSGGTLGGISTGETFEFRVAFKPVSTISKVQKTSTYSGEMIDLQGKGRHDPCVLPRAPAIVDNMAAMVIMDLLMRQKARTQ